MQLALENKHALVTGSTAGIGFAIAEALVAEGASVHVNGRTAARVEDAVTRLRQKYPGARVKGIVADLATAAGAAAVVSQLETVDILVNNMGIFEPKPFAEIPDADWLRFFETNVMSGVRLCRHYFGRMLKANWGRIIFISSESALNIPGEMIHYGMTKTCQLALARGLASQTAGTGVTVNSVLPGPTRSEGVGTFVQDMARHKGITEEAMEKDFFQTVRPLSLLRRFATSEEVASLVAYLSSPLAAATNGAAMRADGGILQGLV